MPTLHRRPLMAATTLLLLALPAPAFAARAEVVGDELRLTAAPGEVNQAGLTRNAAGELAFFDNRTDLTVGAGCRIENQYAVCSPQGVNRVTVALANRRDSLSIEARVPALSYSGGSSYDRVDYVGDPLLGSATVTLDGTANDGREGRDNIATDVEAVGGSFVGDTLTGGLKPVDLNGRDGDDTLTGGDGDDEIAAAYVSESGIDLGSLYSEGLDTIACGAGNDQVFADRDDRIAGDCEVIGLPPRSGDRYTYTGSRRADGIVVRQYVNAIVNAGSGNDVVRVPGAYTGRLNGQAGNDDLGGTRDGTERFSGGAGRDKITSRDRNRESVSCGPGRDRVIADKRDKVARDCERVSRR